MKKFISTIIVVLVVASLLTGTVFAAGSSFAPYKSYEYNMFDESIVAPIGYTISENITGSYLGLDKELSSPYDIKIAEVDGEKHIFILDPGNSRILELDNDYKLVQEYANITVSEEVMKEYEVLVSDQEKRTIAFNGATGLAINLDGDFVVADKTGNRVLIIDKETRTVSSVIYRPDEALNDTGATFSPHKVEIDDRGRYYITSESIALGVMIFGNDGKFIEFYGANEVLSTTQAIVKYIRETFYSVTQLDHQESVTPVIIKNMDFDEKGFLYTVSPYRDAENTKAAVEGLVRKLNYNGDDLVGETVIFGDIEENSITGQKTWFHDIDVDQNGFLNILDNSRGRVFQYTDTGTLVSVFGANGAQTGAFGGGAVAIESVGDDILVADIKKNAVFVFSPTDYALNVRKALMLMDNNDFEGSAEVWNAILESNDNSYLCYQGLGRIADYQGEYKKAMEYYKLAYDQEGYALAYQQYRQQLIEKYALVVILAVAVIVVLVFFAMKGIKKLTVPAEGQAYSKMESKYGMEFYVLTHPLDGFAQFKTRKLPSYRVSAIIVFAWLIISILDFNCTGFAFSINRSVDFNMPVTLLLTVGIYIMFCVSNWAICTLIEGKGTMKDIFATTAYSLIPYLVTQGIAVILTNVLVPTESVFITIITTIGLLWTAAVLILGMLTIHEFTVGKTIISLLLTLLGMIAMVLLAILLYSLMKQMFSFFISIYKEISFRY